MSSASTMSAWPFTALPPGTRPDRGSASTMRTIVTAALPETARQRLGPHSLVSDGTAMGYPPPTSGNRQRRADPRRASGSAPTDEGWLTDQPDLHAANRRSQAALCGPERRFAQLL